MRFASSMFVIAAVVISLGAAKPPQPPAQTEQKQSNAELQASANRIVEAIDNVATEKDAGCEDRNDNRSSELCAQWKAADATRDAADYTLWAVLFSFIGTAMVVATFWEQRKVSRAQLRAYIAVDADVFRFGFADGEAEANIKIKNDGQTPAFDLIHCGNVIIRTERQMELDMAATIRANQTPIGIASPTSVHSGQDMNGLLTNHTPFTEEEIKAAVRREKFLYVFGNVVYRDAFNRERETRFCFRLEDFQPPPGKGKVRADKGVWTLTHFHNDAT